MQARSHSLVALALSAALAAPAFAQQVPVFTPNPAPQGANVRMTFDAATPGCGQNSVSSVSRTGNAVRVDYQLVPAPNVVCFSAAPPFEPVALDLGGFPPGQYTVVAVGFNPLFQVAIPPVTGGFGVFPASNVPAISPLAAAVLALSTLLAAGALVMKRRTRS